MTVLKSHLANQQVETTQADDHRLKWKYLSHDKDLSSDG